MTHQFQTRRRTAAYLKKGVRNHSREEDLRAKLTKSLKTGNRCVRSLGSIPPHRTFTSVIFVVRKLKHFQDMGHIAVFLTAIHRNGQIRQAK
jgi:hypothetical protein